MKLEDIPDNSKWYDFFNTEVTNRYNELILEIFTKNFKLDHREIDNNKTNISVKKSFFHLIDGKIIVSIDIFNKDSGESILQEIVSNISQPIQVEITKNRKGWGVEYTMLFIKPEYQGRGYSKVITYTLNKIIKILTRIRKIIIKAEEIGRYAWSRIDGCEFKDISERHKINSLIQVNSLKIFYYLITHLKK